MIRAEIIATYCRLVESLSTDFVQDCKYIVTINNQGSSNPSALIFYRGCLRDADKIIWRNIVHISDLVAVSPVRQAGIHSMSKSVRLTDIPVS
jgi:hypothetical protein